MQAEEVVDWEREPVAHRVELPVGVWEREPVAQPVVLTVTEGEGVADAERHADEHSLIVGDALCDDVWLAEKVPVPQALLVTEGDGEEDEELRAEEHPLPVSDARVESVAHGVKVALAHAVAEVECEMEEVPQDDALAVPDWEGVEVAERHEDTHPLGVGDALEENGVEAENDVETHAVAVADCDRLPVPQLVLLPDRDGDSVEDRQRLGEVLPLADPVVVDENDVDGVKVAEAHAVELAE